MSRYTYQRLVELLDGDEELIALLLEEGHLVRKQDDADDADDRVLVDIDRVLVARTLVRELEIGWAGVDVILRLCDELADARRRIAELEQEQQPEQPQNEARD